MKKTVQRQIILSKTLKLNNHPTADDVYREVNAEHPSISKSTVYRNLHLLVKEGELQSVALPDSPERFDCKTARHFHFTCKCCNEIYDISASLPKSLIEEVEANYNLLVDSEDVVFKGICSKCRK